MSSKRTRAEQVYRTMLKNKLWSENAFKKAKSTGGFVRYDIVRVQTEDGTKRELQRVNNPIMISNASRTFETHDTDRDKFVYVNNVTLDDKSVANLRVAGMERAIRKLLEKFGLNAAEVDKAIAESINASNYNNSRNTKFIEGEKSKKTKSRKKDTAAVLAKIDTSYEVLKASKNKEEGYKIEGKSGKRSKMSLLDRYNRFIKDDAQEGRHEAGAWEGKVMTYSRKDGKIRGSPQDAPKGKTSKWYIPKLRIAASDEKLLREIFAKLFPNKDYDKQNVVQPTRSKKADYLSDSEDDNEEDDEEVEAPAKSRSSGTNNNTRSSRRRSSQAEEEAAEEDEEAAEEDAEEEEKPLKRRKGGRRVEAEDEEDAEDEEAVDLSEVSKRVRGSREKARSSDENEEVEGSAERSEDEDEE